MKKIIYTFCLLISLTYSQSMRSQGMPVYDNTNFIALGQQLISMATQTSEIIKTVQFLKEQKDRIEQVSNAVKNFKTVARLIKRNQQIYDLIQGDLRNLISSPHVTADEAEKLYDRVERLWQISKEDIELIEKILTSNLLKMEDSDRVELLQEAERKADETYLNLSVSIKDYQTIIDFREFQKSVDNANN